MSALGSTVINKSGKKFAPKAAARRPLAPTSAQISARPSVSRQTQSQTPQPQPLPQQVATSAIPSITLPTPASSQQQAVVAPTKITRGNENAAILQPSQGIPVPGKSTPEVRASSISSPSRSFSPIPEVQNQPPETPLLFNRTGVDQAAGPKRISDSITPTPASNRADLVHSNLSLCPNHQSTFRGSPRLISVNESNAVISRSSHASHDEPQAPAAKYRRVEKLSKKSQAVNFSQHDASANEPIPTTESDELAIEASRSADADFTPFTVVAAKEPRVSAQAKRKHQVDVAAAEVIARASNGVTAQVKESHRKARGPKVQAIDGQLSGAYVGSSAESSGQINQGTAHAKPKKKYTKRRSNQSIQDVAAEVVEGAVQGASRDRKERGRKSRRAVTPEGAESVVISPSKVKMSDLCKDSRTGRKSEREKDLEEFQRAEFVRRKQKELQEVVGQIEPENQSGASESSEARLERLSRQREREESVANNVPNTIIVNGQIQIDEESLQIDRHAGAAAERDAEQLEAVDETDLTRKVNSGSWLKHEKRGGWDELMTERFYDGLRMFGTDFEMISKMFPGRTRHKIKLKFVKEEKFNYDKIKATLLGEKIPVDLPELEKMAGIEFDDPQELEREMEEDRRRLEEETLAEKQAMDEARNEREEQIARERAAAGEESSAKENKRDNNRRKKGEEHKGNRGSAKRKDKRASRVSASGGSDALGELGDKSGT